MTDSREPRTGEPVHRVQSPHSTHLVLADAASALTSRPEPQQWRHAEHI